MATSLKDVSLPEGSATLQVLLSDVASLKHDLATMAGHVRGGAADITADVTEAARGAGHQIGDGALRAFDSLAERGRRSARAVGHQVEEHSVVSLLVAFAIGFVGSRLLPR